VGVGLSAKGEGGTESLSIPIRATAGIIMIDWGSCPACWATCPVFLGAGLQRLALQTCRAPACGQVRSSSLLSPDDALYSLQTHPPPRGFARRIYQGLAWVDRCGWQRLSLDTNTVPCKVPLLCPPV
jgi:hypothetical protein